MKKFCFIIFSVFYFFYSCLSAKDVLTIYNMSYDSIFIATYYQKGVLAQRQSLVKEILPRDKAEINRPGRKFFWNREIIFSFKKKDLKKKLKGKLYRDSTHVNIGKLKGKTFYIAPKGEILKGYNTANWKVIRPTLKLFSKPFKIVLNQIKKMVLTGPYSKDIAIVRTGSDLCDSEKDFLEKRRPKVKKSIEKFVGNSFQYEKTPSIAFCCSGGGYRAMIATLGIFAGAEKAGLLDCVTYVSGLSGSTWFITPWIYFGKSVVDYKKKLRRKVAKDLKTTFIDPRIVAKQISKKYLFKQPLTLVDIYGAILANKFFGDLKKSDRLNVSLSDLIKNIKNGEHVFPILTAVQPGPPFTWFEFSPYEVGASFYNSFVPTWALGRKFIDGSSKDFGPEQSLGYFMGIWGSAFTFSFKRGIEEIQGKMPSELESYMKQYIEFGGKEETRLSPAKLNNYAYQMNIDFGRMKYINLVDAGLDFNLPFPPLLREERQVDIIIVCDASASAYKGAPAIKKAEKWANQKGIKFPKIDYNNIGKKIISVFKDETDNSVPTIIYMPIVKNNKFNKKFDPVKEIKSGFCKTFNFKYSLKQFDLLSGLMEHNIIESKDVIKKEIKNKIESKK